MLDLRTATVDEMRHWLAEQGIIRGHCRCDDPKCPLRFGPIPASIDAIAAVWREELKGWWLTLHRDEDGGGWTAYKSTGSHEPGTFAYAMFVEVPYTGDELTDRLRLTCLAVEAERSGT